MILCSVPPQVIATVLDLAGSVQPHKLTVAALYKEIITQCLSADGDQAEAIGQLGAIMSSVSQHESEGLVCVKNYVLCGLFQGYKLTLHCCNPFLFINKCF